MEPVGKASGVEYFDDSKATNPHATLSALEGFERVVLLAGGDSKGVDLGRSPGPRSDCVGVVAIGDTPEEVERARWSRPDGPCRVHGRGRRCGGRARATG